MKRTDFKNFAIASLAFGCIMSLVVFAVSVKSSDLAMMEEPMQRLSYIFGCLAICLVTVAPFAGIMFVLFLFLDYQALRTAIHLTANKLSAHQITKNSNKIAPCLQAFLFETIKRNNDMLHIPLGQDISSLNSVGYSVRNNCVFYRFNIVSDKPDYDNNMIQQILQSIITSELKHYGIYGLSAIYSSVTTHCQSIYVDRVYYDEDNHTLSLDILYICTEQSAKYWQNAMLRNTKQVEAERTVYDDEI